MRSYRTIRSIYYSKLLYQPNALEDMCKRARVITLVSAQHDLTRWIG